MLRLILILTFGLAQPAAGQDAEELELAREVLTDLQAPSFMKKREYCGFLALTRQGELIATDPVAGDMASCAAVYPVDVAVVASFHTHGNFDEGYFNEMPSTIDIESDSESFINGYVATPGGRFWYIDGRLKVTHQICGVGCLPVAPLFSKATDDAVAQAYTYDDLRRLQR
ncbi:DUF4329 domain-containing protein [Loktanella sp. DJP18]|uniref:DUF4329 domain-containing protein n=1 Tax=Loktanella sp. DJP18 TaxID=3409788 RepID=UPI003BB80F4C